MPAGFSKIGDDVAYMSVFGRRLVIKSDMLVKMTDVPRGMTYRQAARKSVAMCVSDFAAKGVRPAAFTISLGVPRRIKSGEVDGLASGLADAVAEWGVMLIGGDTNEADDLIIDCTMVGIAKKVVERGGASPGELVVTTGQFGYPAAGLKIMLNGAKAESEFRLKAIRSVTNPSPSLELGVTLSRYLSSSTDSSDGLAICLYNICDASGVGMTIDNIPVPKEIIDFANQNGYSVEELAMYGGEEYLIVGTLKESLLERASVAARRAGGRLYVIGRTNSETGIVRSAGVTKPIERRGWIHLS